MQEQVKSSTLRGAVEIQSPSSRKQESGWSPESSPLVKERNMGVPGFKERDVISQQTSGRWRAAWQSPRLVQ